MNFINFYTCDRIKNCEKGWNENSGFYVFKCRVDCCGLLKILFKNKNQKFSMSFFGISHYKKSSQNNIF